jgi:predicted GNAT family N-acyltransferase
MKLQDFHVQIVDWSRQSDRRALQEVRHAVFVLEQGVPPEHQQDALDAAAWHVLARDLSGRPIGCGRLTADGSIGRLAVLPDWRGQGLGSALLHGLVERVRALGWPQASLTALASATGFYARAGFRAVGDAFIEAGLPHQTMRLALTSAPLLSRIESPRSALPAGNRDELAAARRQLLTRTKHRLAIELPRLDEELYSSSEELDELRRIATSGRGAQIRILLRDPAAALREGHRLLPLVQRLTSVFLVRHPIEEADLASMSSCLLTDTGGYLLQPDAGRPQGRAALADRAVLAPLEQRFDERWERAARAGMLQPLDL